MSRSGWTGGTVGHVGPKDQSVMWDQKTSRSWTGKIRQSYGTERPVCPIRPMIRSVLLDRCPPNTALPPKPNSVPELRLGGCWTIVVVRGWLADLVVVKVEELTEMFGLSIGLLILVHLGLEFFHALEVKNGSSAR